MMRKISMILLFDRRARLLVYLRDDKPEIPFPNHWDLFGGHVETGETPEAALIREVEEELGVVLTEWKFFRRYECIQGDAYPNVKYVYWTVLDRLAEELTLYEGQRLEGIDIDQRHAIRFANILGTVVDDFVAAGLWPQPVDKSGSAAGAK